MIPSARVEAQTFGQYTTATVASEGEGGLFASVADEQFRTGAIARFMISGRSDLGFQLGFDRSGGRNSAGFGADLKYIVTGDDSSVPIDMALDLSLGHFRAESNGYSLVGFAFLISGTLIAETQVPVEPYGSIGLYTSFLHNGDQCEGLGPECDDDDTDTETMIHAGAKIRFSDEYQLLLEVRIDGRTSFGVAINVVF